MASIFSNAKEASRPVLALFLGLIWAGTIAFGGESAAAQWVPLFNGKDLSGWQAYGDEEWVVEKGTIVGKSKAGLYGYLGTTKNYRDFRLRVRFKCEAKGNSGVFFRSRVEGADQYGPAIKGIQAEVDPSAHTGGLYDSTGRGWLIKPTAAGEAAYKPNAWNKMEILVHGNRIVTWLNGLQIVDYTDPQPGAQEGMIALQLHSGGGVGVRWKDLYIQEITPAGAK